MRRHLRTALILGLTIGLMAFFLRNAELGRVWDAIRGARPDLLLLSVVCALLTYGIRVERWRILLLPMVRTRFGHATRATVIGFAANALVPGRVGEVLRPFVLSRHEPVTASAAFATIVLERLLDLLAVVLVVATVVTLLHPPTTDPALLTTLQAGAIVTGVGGLAASVLIVLMASWPARAEQVAARGLAFLPSGLGRLAAGLFQRFLTGLAVVQRPATLVVGMAMSIVLWVGIAAGIWAATVAFGIELPFAGAVVLMGLAAIGVSVPTPAGAGGYHAAYQLGVTSLYGAGNDQAVAAALVNHLIAFGPITLLGLVFMAQEGLRPGALTTVTAAPDAAGVATAEAAGSGPVADEGGRAP